MNFRINTQNLFLTYSRCDITREDLCLALKGLCPNWRYILVAEEKHEDGAPHLHAVVQMKARKDIINPRFFDIRTFHPKIESCKDVSASIDYVKKDGRFIEEGTANLPAKKKKKLTNHELLTCDLKEMIDNDTIDVMQLEKIQRARLAYQTLGGNPNPTCATEIPNHWDGLALPLIDGKRRHYWLYSSEPDKGKTTFQNMLNRLYRCSWYSCKQTFQSEINSDSQFLFFDEFGKGNSVKITDLNAMCDGSYQYPVKGKPSVRLNLPIIIICSNYCIDQVYKETVTVYARFNEIDISNYSFI